MTIDQALQMIAALAQASIKAIEDGEPNIDLLDSLKAADDVARNELAKAIEDANKRLTAAE